MRYWDASAVVPLCVRQDRSDRMRELVDQDADMVVWWATPVECVSAVERLRREGFLTDDDEAAALRILDTAADRWLEILPSARLRAQAIRMLRVHALRAADALQLAAALEWRGARHEGGEFVALDDRLANAARLEGFTVLAPAEGSAP